MDLVETESFCSNSSSDINLPKDYSLSSTEMSVKSESIETNNNNNIINNSSSSKSMKLNFGMDRLLSKCDKKFERSHIIDEMLMNRNLFDKSSFSQYANDHEVLLNLSANNANNQPDIGSNQLGINLLHQQLTHVNNNGLTSSPNQSFVLKPFPIRFGRNHNGFAHQPPSYFQSNFRKVSMTPNIANSPPYPGSYHHSIMRLPAINQMSPNSNVTQFYSQKISKSSNSSETKVQQNSNGASNVKRKRSWSRAVFSNLQRKGLERQFEFQKYITKPDRKKLAARLGLKDAQVKVWFQNRRMKWRHTTRGTTIPSKIIDASENAELNEDDEHFTSSSSDNEDGDIDVVTDN